MSRVRALLVAAATAVVLALVPGAAGAHGGYQIEAKSNGPYSVVVRVRPFEFRGVDKIDLTTYLVRQDIGEPDLNARVELILDGPDGHRVLHPTVVGDGYETIIDAKPDAWRKWRTTAHVRGPAGTATVTSEPFGSDPVMPGWIIPLSLCAVILAGAVWFIRRDGRDVGPSAGDDAPDDDREDDWLVERSG